ncbi:MAG: hypothetical protein ACYC69_00340 [Thermodesulfovibrionales bacterium]
MDIKILEEAASGKVREQTHEEAEKFMARIRTNLFDLLCHSDKARVELPLSLDLSEYGGKEAVERAIGKAVVNLLALGAVFGVKTCDVILRELGYTLAEATEQIPIDYGLLSQSAGIVEAEQSEQADEKAGSAVEHRDPAPAAEVDGKKGDDKTGYRQMLDKSVSVEERTVIWKKIRLDRGLDSQTRAELYQHMAGLNKQEAA